MDIVKEAGRDGSARLHTTYRCSGCAPWRVRQVCHFECASPMTDRATAARALMAVLAQASPDELEGRWRDGTAPPPHRMLRPPETGLVMVRGRAGGTGARFNVGEMTVTRCAVELEGGAVGLAYIARARSASRRAGGGAGRITSGFGAPRVLEHSVVAPLAAAQTARRRAAAERVGRSHASNSSPWCAGRTDDCCPGSPTRRSTASGSSGASSKPSPGPVGSSTWRPRSSRPSPLHPVTAAVCLTLLDFDTPLWLDDAAARPEAVDWLKFHCGMPLAAEPARARLRAGRRCRAHAAAERVQHGHRRISRAFRYGHRAGPGPDRRHGTAADRSGHRG